MTLTDTPTDPDGAQAEPTDASDLELVTLQLRLPPALKRRLQTEADQRLWSLNHTAVVTLVGGIRRLPPIPEDAALLAREVNAAFRGELPPIPGEAGFDAPNGHGGS